MLFNIIYIVAYLLGMLRRLTRPLNAYLKAPIWGLFFDLAGPKNLAC
jgi:hypothetical protein